MVKLLTATLSSKAQLTLPKEVRELLGVKNGGDLLGFLVDADHRMVQLTRVETALVDEEFTQEEYRKLLRLPRQRGGKRFRTVDQMIRELKRR